MRINKSIDTTVYTFYHDCLLQTKFGIITFYVIGWIIETVIFFTDTFETKSTVQAACPAIAACHLSLRTGNLIIELFSLGNYKESFANYGAVGCAKRSTSILIHFPYPLVFMAGRACPDSEVYREMTEQQSCPP